MCSAWQQAPKDSLSKRTKWCFTFMCGWLPAALFNTEHSCSFLFLSLLHKRPRSTVFVWCPTSLNCGHLPTCRWGASPPRCTRLTHNSFCCRCCHDAASHRKAWCVHVRRWRKAERKPFEGDCFWTQKQPNGKIAINSGEKNICFVTKWSRAGVKAP